MKYTINKINVATADGKASYRIHFYNTPLSCVIIEENHSIYHPDLNLTESGEWIPAPGFAKPSADSGAMGGGVRFVPATATDPSVVAAIINFQSAMLNADIAGMSAENSKRLSSGETIAYNDSDFAHVAAERHAAVLKVWPGAMGGV